MPPTSRVAARRTPERPQVIAPTECPATEMTWAASLLVVPACHGDRAAVPEEPASPAMPITDIAGMGVDHRRVADSDTARCRVSHWALRPVARPVCSGTEPEFEPMPGDSRTARPTQIALGCAARNGPWSAAPPPAHLQSQSAGAGCRRHDECGGAGRHSTGAHHNRERDESPRELSPFWHHRPPVFAADKGVLRASSSTAIRCASAQDPARHQTRTRAACGGSCRSSSKGSLGWRDW